MKLQEGEVFAIKTSTGFGFIQYVHTMENGIELVRVLEPINTSMSITQLEVDEIERFNILFLVKTAFNKKIIEKVGSFKLPSNYRIPKKTRTQHIIRGEFLGWHIVDFQTLQRELKKELTKDELMLSPHGIFNDTLIIEYLEKDWRLSNWQ